MKIADLIAKLTDLSKQEGKVELDATEALHQAAQPIYQAVYDRGHGQATKDLNQKVADAETAKTKAETDLAAANELFKGKPDVEALRAQHRTDLERVQNQAKTREEALQKRLQEERSGRALSDFRGHLKGKVVDDYAVVLAERPDLKSRIRHKEDGKVYVVQAGTEVEVQVPAGKDPLQLLAEEVIQSAPSTLRLSGADGGSGITTGATGATGGSYDPVAAGKQMAEAAKASAKTAEIALR